ncbi:hypothetical protein DL770_006880 [Monosporascus sp. CRB-9-2]|nr:hypothetical protein DL770_006880 [Monosporascus sp. CRB-9-2]
MAIPWDCTLIDRIDEVAVAQPDCVAIKDDNGRSLTYGQMMARTRQIANQLRTYSASPGSHVAMLLDPIADAVCCILALMRLGLVWIPLRHPQPPSETCRDKAASVLDNNAVVNVSKPPLTAAILYTSGSTGAPKGVLLTHGGLMNSIYVTTMSLGIGREITLQQSPLGFDLVLDQVFLALPNEGTIIMVGKDGRGDPLHIAQLMVKEHVTLTHFVPSEYLTLLNYGQHILKHGRSWRFALSAGAKMGHEVYKAFRKLEGLVPYRADEDVLASSDYLRPSPNYLMGIRDQRMNIVPVGFPGEICISGPSTALEYLNRPEETQQKFVEVDLGVDPDNNNNNNNNNTRRRTKAYRSGDFGRILPDGTLQVLGRLDGDSQVKIHGIRVELGEIANVIVEASDGAISNAAVSLRRPREILAVPSGTLLVAFVVFNVAFVGNKAEFVERLKTTLPLPLYMSPTFIIPIDRIPATSNGKTDRLAFDSLPIPDDDTTDTSTGLTDMEAAVREVWHEVLSHRMARKARVNPDSDFFHVGGNSLLLIKLQTVLILRDMAGRMAAAHKTSAQGMDWNNEISALVHGLPQPLGIDLAHGPQTGLVILLTGATGFLGTSILQLLVDDARVKQIHCIAIRVDDSGRARHVSVKSGKIVEYTGDLGDYSLGLSTSEYTWLAENVHLIIHNGADISFLRTYASLRRTNTVSTRTLCELAIPRGIPFHFVSTVSVAKFTGLSPLLKTSVASHLPPSDIVDGYAASKWASEALLERACSDHSLPTWIHRPSNLVGDGAPNLDMVSAVLKYSKVLGLVPVMNATNMVGQFDLVPLADASRRLVDTVFGSFGSCTQSEPDFVHLCNHTKLPPEELKAYIQDQMVGYLEEVSWQD